MNLDESIDEFAHEIGAVDPVTITGAGTRGGPVAGVRAVSAPNGVDWIQPAEMTVRCGGATPVADLDAALAEYGQCVAIPTSGTVGGALALGHSGLRRLGWGPVRDTVLQTRYVSAAGDIVKAGGPTVKNVSGFDLCRLLVGSCGTLGFLADVILRTRPRPTNERWYTTDQDPWDLLVELYRPTSLLWDGSTTWVLLDGHPRDVAAQVDRHRLGETAGPPMLHPHRDSVSPGALGALRDEEPGTFVAEIGVGVVHRAEPRRRASPTNEVVELHRRIKHEFDPAGRMNPGVDVLVGR